jgi:hypothetical protein
MVEHAMELSIERTVEDFQKVSASPLNNLQENDF